ncbi:MAG: proline dehydrogenase family protein [Carbonactinosporaceae bacterium]
MLRQVLLTAADSAGVRKLVETVPVSRGVVARYVAGRGVDDAVRVAGELMSAGLLVSLDYLGEHTYDRRQAEANRDAYLGVLRSLGERGLTAGAEVSVKLSALGQALADGGEKVALANAQQICDAAQQVGTTVTLDMEDHTTTDSTLGILRDLRTDFPSVGAVLQAYLRRTDGDCRDLRYAGSRVRLCKGAYREPASVSFQDPREVDRSYVRCLRTLMTGAGYPMVATHDPRLLEIAGALAVRHGREQGDYEYQMLYGVRPHEQRRLARSGERMRVYVPYGHEWYGYLMRRLAERPANIAFFLRSLATKG